ncbi:GntR family transcriptional regulator [Thermodesulfobacteriota bacterium]
MKKISLKTLHQEVADRIFEMIRKGQLQMGQKIVENELAESLGVSRTPLREALRLLSAEGLVELIPNKGAFVKKLSENEIFEMYEALALFEGTFAKKAVERMSEQELKKLEELHRQMEQHYENGDIEKYANTNYRYHACIQEMVKNNTISSLLNNLERRAMLSRCRQLRLKGRFDESMKEHRAIIKAFRKRDASAAEFYLKVHFVNQCEALIGRKIKIDSAEKKFLTADAH